MILFCGIASEPPLALAIEAACRRGIPHLVFHQRDARFCDIALDHGDGRMTGRLWAQEREWALEEFTGVYTRLMESDALPELQARRETREDPNGIARANALHEILSEWIELAPCRVVNRAAAMASNISKPYQLQLISRFFRVPPTLVTNAPDDVRAFRQQHGRVIYKSLSSVRSIVRELSPADEKRLEKIRALPTQFQAFITGTNIRVHVVENTVFATEIVSPAVDYRYAEQDGLDVTMRPVELPPEVVANCCQLAARLRLPFCGIDLKRTEAGSYYCFEVNPSPAYSYYQERAGQPIADALVSYLVTPREQDYLKVPRQ